MVLLAPAANTNQPNVFQPEQQVEFNADLVYLFSVCSIPWNTAAHLIFKCFIEKYIPGTHIPCQQLLAGQALDDQVDKAEVCVKEKVTGGLGMGQCDGWKNMSRTPVVRVMMTVRRHVSSIPYDITVVQPDLTITKPYILQVHDICAESRSGEHLYVLMRLNIEYVETTCGEKWIGWCTDARGNTRKAHKLAIPESPQLIYPDCWGHQVSLIDPY